MSEELRLTLRLPPAVAVALRERSAAEHRSLNSQIVFLLQQALFPPVDADAYRGTRRSLGSMPHYTFPRPITRRPRGGGGNG